MNEQQTNYELIGHRGEQMLDTGLFNIWIKWFFDNEEHTHKWKRTGSVRYTCPTLLQEKCSCGKVRWVDGHGIPMTKKTFLEEHQRLREKYPQYFDKEQKYDTN